MSPCTVVIVGPTAVGKTDLSLDVAEQLGAQIINADSMQLYRGMDIGTAKLPLEQRRGITHHMLDVLDVSQEASVAMYQQAARDVIAQLHAGGTSAVVVGGSGLFVNALLDDMQFPGSDPSIRARLEAEAQREGAQYMYAKLQAVDEQAAAHVLPTNLRRIVRALEVVELTGQAPSTTLRQLAEVVPALRIGLTRPREDLDQRIALRVDHMWRDGLVAEVSDLEAMGLRQGRTASKALGYQQVLAALAGECTMDQAREATVVGTRRFVRRQQSWFGRDSRIHWLDASTTQASDVLALLP